VIPWSWWPQVSKIRRIYAISIDQTAEKIPNQQSDFEANNDFCFTPAAKFPDHSPKTGNQISQMKNALKAIENFLVCQLPG
jgi:hypothetical protein